MSGERAVVTLGAITVETWESYDLQSDILTPADSFTLSLMFDPFGDTAALREQIASSARISVYIGADLDGAPRFDALQITGLVQRRAWEASRKGSMLRLEGLDNGGMLTRASADITVATREGTLFVDVVRQIVEPFGMTVITDSSIARQTLTGRTATWHAARLTAERQLSGSLPIASILAAGGARAERERQIIARASRRYANQMAPSTVEQLTLSDAKPQVGETVWEFIDRHARRLGVLPWIDPHGRLILSAPLYEQPAMYRIVRRLRPSETEPNNVLEGRLSEALTAPSEVTVYGRSGSQANAARSRFHANVQHPSPVSFMPLVVHDNTVRSAEEAERRARREMAERRMDEWQLTYTVAGHGQGGVLWGIDTMVDVTDEVFGINGLYYLAGRRFTNSRAEGARTELTLIKPGAIVL